MNQKINNIIMIAVKNNVQPLISLAQDCSFVEDRLWFGITFKLT